MMRGLTEDQQALLEQIEETLVGLNKLGRPHMFQRRVRQFSEHLKLDVKKIKEDLAKGLDKRLI